MVIMHDPSKLFTTTMFLLDNLQDRTPCFDLVNAHLRLTGIITANGVSRERLEGGSPGTGL
jgi:hypothetical protein